MIRISEPIRKIAVFRALFLGDLLVALPALRALRQRFPTAEITLISLAWTHTLATYLAPFVDRLVEFPGYSGIPEGRASPYRMACGIERERAYKYDLAIQMHGDGSVSNGFVADLGAGFTLGYARPGDTRLSCAAPIHDNVHEIWRWLNLVGLLGADTADPRIAFVPMPEDDARADALSAALPGDAPLIALHVGANDPKRRWPVEQFALLADALYDRYGARLVLTGTEAEQALTSAVCNHARAPLHDLSGATDIGTLAALLKRVDLLVTNDTGTSHLAAAVETPSVVLFGPAQPAQWAPLNHKLHTAVDALTYAPPHTTRADALACLPMAPVLQACTAQLDDHLLRSTTGRQPVAHDSFVS